MSNQSINNTACYPPAAWCSAERERIPLPPLRGTKPWNLFLAWAASRISGCRGVMNVFHMMLHCEPTFFGFMLSLNGRMSRKTALSPREKERLILYVTCSLGCTYEYTYHYRRARAAGLTAEDAKRASMGDGADTRERLAYAAAASLLETRNLPDVLLEELKCAYSTAEIYELIEIVGSYDMVAMVDNALDVPIEDGMWLTEKELTT